MPSSVILKHVRNPDPKESHLTRTLAQGVTLSDAAGCSGCISDYIVGDDWAKRGLPGTDEYRGIRVFVGSLGKATSLLPFDLAKPIVALYRKRWALESYGNSTIGF